MSTTIARRRETTWIVKGYCSHDEYIKYKDAVKMYGWQKKRYGQAELVKKTITTEVITEYTTRWKT
jgi:hypothetical protein